jgi:hypothetical protein
MVIARHDAQRFIGAYTRILLSLSGQDSRNLKGERRLKALDAGRRKLIAGHQSVGDGSIFSPEDDDGVRRAIREVVFARWVYLRDTTRYSILVDPAREESYAVLGLNDPLAAIFNGPGVSFEAGVCPLDGVFVCDGLFADMVHIGPNMRADFRALQSRLVREGRFHKRP